MKKKFLVLIVLSLLLGGLLVVFQAHREAQRSREYEVSLVKALKNSYRDLEEIHILHAVYYEEPGNWGCTLEIIFSDGNAVKYNLGHGLNNEVNRSAIAHPDILDLLANYYGTTDSKVQVIYSNGDKEVQ